MGCSTTNNKFYYLITFWIRSYCRFFQVWREFSTGRMTLFICNHQCRLNHLETPSLNLSNTSEGNDFVDDFDVDWNWRLCNTFTLHWKIVNVLIQMLFKTATVHLKHAFRSNSQRNKPISIMWIWYSRHKKFIFIAVYGIFQTRVLINERIINFYYLRNDWAYFFKKNRWVYKKGIRARLFSLENCIYMH